MKPTYSRALSETAGEVGRCVVHPAAWRDVGAGMVALAFILLRVVMLLAFPVTVPLVALLKLRDERRRAVSEPLARARLRAGIHRNGGRNGL